MFTNPQVPPQAHEIKTRVVEIMRFKKYLSGKVLQLVPGLFEAVSRGICRERTYVSVV